MKETIYSTRVYEMYELSYYDIPTITISAVGTVSNILLLIAFIKDPLKCFRNSATYLVMNLAISDCVASLFATFLPLILAKLGSHIILGSLIHWFGSASCVSIASISVDRFLMITYPFRHRILMEGKVMIVWLAAIWIVSCVLPFIGFLRGLEKTSLNAIYIFDFTFIILAATMYALTYHKLKNQLKNIGLQNSTESRARELRVMKEKNFLNSVIIIASIAFVCLVPSNIFFAFNTRRRNSSLTLKFSTFLSIYYANFAVNPLIYIARLPNYRKTFYLLYCCRRSS